MTPSRRKPVVERERRAERFAAATAEDVALVEAALARAAAVAAKGKRAGDPAQRAEALAEMGLLPTGRAAADRQLLEAAARVKRDRSVVGAHELGLTAATIAERFDLTVADVGQVLAAHRASRAGAPLPPSPELLRDAVDALTAQMERLSLLASQASTPEAARVSALREWRAMSAQRLGLLGRLGHVDGPEVGDGARLELAREVLRGLPDALRAEGVSQDTLDRATARLLATGQPSTFVRLARAQ